MEGKEDMILFSSSPPSAYCIIITHIESTIEWTRTKIMYCTLYMSFVKETNIYLMLR